MGGDLSDNGGHFWHALREQQLPFFHSSGNLWRLSIAPATQPLDLPGEWLYDWGGAQRWLKSDAPAEQIFQAAEAVGGHATLMRTEQPASERFQPLPAPLMRYHQRLKEAFDPAHLFNPNRLYPGW